MFLAGPLTSKLRLDHAPQQAGEMCHDPGSALWRRCLYSAGRARLLDVPRLVSQYTALERCLMPGGWSRIDQPNGPAITTIWRTSSRATSVPPSVCELCTPEFVARFQAVRKYRRPWATSDVESG
jgi:hypothetical protein